MSDRLLLDRVRDAIEATGSRTKNHDGRDGFRAQCPAHEDRHASLEVDWGSKPADGRVVVWCGAGCTLDAILAACGLTNQDLFPATNGQLPAPALAAAPGSGSRGPEPSAQTYTYADVDGTVLFQVVRQPGKQFRQRRPDDQGGWVWSVKGVKRVPYRLPDLAAQPDAPVYIVEGEKDADRLAAAGLVATCNAGGAGKWRREDSLPLKGRHVAILPDNDQPGRDHAAKVAADLTGLAASIRIIQLPDLPDKGDVSDWLDAGNSIDQLRQLVRDTPEWSLDSGDEPGQGSSWGHIDPTPYLDGTYTPPQPTQLARSDDVHLFYPGRVNLLFGESEAGKGWVCLHAVAQALKRGENVVYLDFEDYPDTIYDRLRLLGCTPDQLAVNRFRYHRPDGPLDDAARDAIGASMDQLHPALVVLDGMTGAMRLLGLDDHRGTEIDEFYALLPQPLAATGAAVCLIDHVAKDAASRGKGPIGSQMKRARVSGASYQVEVIAPLAPGRAGKLKLGIDKDRLGAVRREHPKQAGIFELDATITPLVAVLHPPEQQGQDPSEWRPTVLMQRVSVALEDTVDGLTQTQVTKAVTGKYDFIVKALDQLVADGYATVEEGPRGAKIHRSVRPFRADRQALTPSRPSSTPSDRLLGAGGGQGGSPDATPSHPLPGPLKGSGGRGSTALAAEGGQTHCDCPCHTDQLTHPSGVCLGCEPDDQEAAS